MTTVGLPRSLFYYYDEIIWKNFFEYLNVPYILSPLSNKSIQKKGDLIANSEMCLAFKNYLGHIDYLKDKCDYILVPRIDNYNINNQTCTNFLAAYDIVNNLYNIKILNYDIDIQKHKTLKKGLITVAYFLGISKKDAVKAYYYAMHKYKKYQKNSILQNNKNLNSNKIKILIVAHPYVIYDEFMGKDILKYLKEENIAIIYSDRFDKKKALKESEKLASNLYFIYARENVGAVSLSQNKVDGIIFVSSFPCALDSLANELLMLKVKIPYINIVIDDATSFAGIETRLESFIDLLKERKHE